MDNRNQQPLIVEEVFFPYLLTRLCKTNKNAAKITKIAEFWYENLHMSEKSITFALEIRNELIITILITKNLAMI